MLLKLYYFISHRSLICSRNASLSTINCGRVSSIMPLHRYIDLKGQFNPNILKIYILSSGLLSYLSRLFLVCFWCGELSYAEPWRLEPVPTFTGQEARNTWDRSPNSPQKDSSPGGNQIPHYCHEVAVLTAPHCWVD